MIEPTSIVAIVLASLTSVAGIITGLHIKRMNSGCCDIECFKTPPSTPTITLPTLHTQEPRPSIYVTTQSTV